MLIKAGFNPLIRPYLVITIGFTLAITLVGIPLAIVWFCGVGRPPALSKLPLSWQDRR